MSTILNFVLFVFNVTGLRFVDRLHGWLLYKMFSIKCFKCFDQGEEWNIKGDFWCGDSNSFAIVTRCAFCNPGPTIVYRGRSVIPSASSQEAFATHLLLERGLAERVGF